MTDSGKLRQGKEGQIVLKVNFDNGYYQEGEELPDSRLETDVRALWKVIQELKPLDVETVKHLLLTTIVLDRFSAELKPDGKFPFDPANKVIGPNRLLRILTTILHDVGKARYIDITTSKERISPIPPTFKELLEKLPSLQNNPDLRELLRKQILLHQFEPELTPELTNKFTEQLLRECLKKFKLQLAKILGQELPQELPQELQRNFLQSPDEQQIFREFYRQFYLQVSQKNGEIKLIRPIWHLLLNFSGINDQDKKEIRLMIKNFYRMANHPLVGFKKIIDLLKKHESEISPNLLDYLLGTILRHHSRQDSDENPRSYPKRVVLDEINKRLKKTPLPDEYEGLTTLVNFEAELSRFVDILVALFFDTRKYQKVPKSLETDFDIVFGTENMKQDGFSQEFIDFISSKRGDILKFLITLKQECDQFIRNVENSLQSITEKKVGIFGKDGEFETVKLADVLKIEAVRKTLFGGDVQSLTLIQGIFTSPN